MIFLTQNDIEELKSRGIKGRQLYLEPSPVRIEQAKRLISEIENAFSEVRLGNGIGLFEGQALDDYETEEERLKKRAKDEKSDWRRIEAKNLNACSSSLSFFDPEGMLFNLPAFICSELRGEYEQGLDISLSFMDDWSSQKYSLFSPKQKSTVAKFIKFLAEDVDSEYSRPALERNLEEFWLKK